MTSSRMRSGAGVINGPDRMTNWSGRAYEIFSGAEQLLNVVPVELLGERFLAFQGRFDHLALAGLQLEDFFFNGVASD